MTFINKDITSIHPPDGNALQTDDFYAAFLHFYE